MLPDGVDMVLSPTLSESGLGETTPMPPVGTSETVS